MNTHVCVFRAQVGIVGKFFVGVVFGLGSAGMVTHEGIVAETAHIDTAHEAKAKD